MRRFFLAALLTAAAAPAFCAELTLMPVTVHLDRQHDRATIQVTNTGAEPAVMQVEAAGWKRDQGVDIEEPTHELIVNPPIFTVAPGKTQIVRLGVRRSETSEHEATFRLVMRELPPPADTPLPSSGPGVRVLVELKIPVYVEPAVVHRDERWHAHYDNSGNLVADVTNAGNVHYRVAEVRVSDDEPAIVTRGPAAVLFPGEARSFQFKSHGTPGSVPVVLEVTTDRGVQRVPVEPDGH